MAHRSLAPALALALAFLAPATLGGCGSSAEGGYVVTGPQSFRVSPNTCRMVSSGYPDFALAIDLYRLDPRDDTELVLAGEHVLVRLPGRGLMVRMDRPDCRVLDFDVHPTNVTVNHVPVMAGHVAVDCERPELGHVEGRASFSCYP